MYKENIKEEIVQFAKLLDEKDLVNCMEGNLSIIDREENMLYISPSSKRKSLLTTDMIAVLNDKGDQVEGELKRSTEYRLHEAVFKGRPDCNAAIHSHCSYLTAFAFCNMDIELKCTASFILGFTKIPCLPYGEPGTAEICRGISETVKDYNLILLGNHGVICVEKDMETCMRVLEGAEAIVKTYVIAKMVGETVDLPQAKIESLLANHPFSKKLHK